MQGWNFYVPTITQAMRGKEALRTAGIRSFVGRNTDMKAGRGCSYSITVPNFGEKAERILLEKHIDITRKETGQ